jgi:hypothetical protein
MLNAMKKDTTGKFWLITGLSSGIIIVINIVDTTSLRISFVKLQILILLFLSPFDDPFIPAASYPNMPVYPVGAKLPCTNRKGSLSLSAATTNFVKPEKEKLVVYELFSRDFDAKLSRFN